MKSLIIALKRAGESMGNLARSLHRFDEILDEREDRERFYPLPSRTIICTAPNAEDFHQQQSQHGRREGDNGS